jgi:hypothetical protein
VQEKEEEMTVAMRHDSDDGPIYLQFCVYKRYACPSVCCKQDSQVTG